MSVLLFYLFAVVIYLGIEEYGLLEEWLDKALVCIADLEVTVFLTDYDTVHLSTTRCSVDTFFLD